MRILVYLVHVVFLEFLVPPLFLSSIDSYRISKNKWNILYLWWRSSQDQFPFVRILLCSLFFFFYPGVRAAAAVNECWAPATWGGSPGTEDQQSGEGQRRSVWQPVSPERKATWGEDHQVNQSTLLYWTHTQNSPLMPPVLCFQQFQPCIDSLSVCPLTF